MILSIRYLSIFIIYLLFVCFVFCFGLFLLLGCLFLWVVVVCCCCCCCCWVVGFVLFVCLLLFFFLGGGHLWKHVNPIKILSISGFEFFQ